jgi:hypothetical protein
VPAGLIEAEDRVRAGREPLGEGRQERAHARGGRLGQGEGEGFVRAGPAGGGEQVEALEPLAGRPGRAHAALVPAVAGPAFLPDPGLALTPELDLRSRMGFGDGGELRPEPLFRAPPARRHSPRDAGAGSSGAAAPDA